METDFYSLQEYLLCTKSIAYIIMGLILILLPLFWIFITGRDEKKRTF